MVNKIKRQVTLPSIAIGLLEVFIFCGVFLVTGIIGLNSAFLSLILPMFVFAAVMMGSMVLTGVYRSDISRSIIHLHQRTAIGYAIAAIGLLILAALSSSDYFDMKFLAIVLLFSFFVVSTIRPVIVEGRVFKQEGDRRIS